jgi:hypothetical protein
MAGQTAPRRRRIGVAGADRAGLVGHPARSLHGVNADKVGPMIKTNRRCGLLMFGCGT